jgi:hypothetical protein
MADEFGPNQAEVLISDLALLEMGDKTPRQLLEAGEDPKLIWQAICQTQSVPKKRWLGLDKKAKKQHAE